MEINVLEIVIVLAALAMLMSPLLLWAYQMGSRTAATGKSARFERIPVELRLNDTLWRIEFDEDDALSPRRVGILHLRQLGPRVFGEVSFPQGHRQSFEGLLIGQRISYVSLDDATGHEVLGTVLLDVDTNGSHMTGVCNRWASDSDTLLLRKVTATRTGPDGAGL